MVFKSPLLVVSDLDRSKAFYKRVLGLDVIEDFGANITLTGGLSLQTQASFEEFISAKPGEIVYGGKNSEIYFEEDDFDGFVKRLRSLPDINYVHPPLEHRWGQRAVRIYDPDRHIIEVGENMYNVCLRFMAGGMTAEETAIRMDVPESLVREAVIYKESEKTT